MTLPALDVLEVDPRTLPHEIASAEIQVPEYKGWRSSLERFRERANRREEGLRLIEANNKSLERRREEARERNELEEKRRCEAAARAEQRRLEASEYSSWRADLVLSRRAEERARAAEHIQWRTHLTKLQKGVSGDDVSLSSRSSCKVTTESTLQRGAFGEGSNLPSRSTCKVVTTEGWQRPGIFDASYSARECNAAADVIERKQQQLLSEEDAWNAMVRRNKEAIQAEREQSKATDMRKAVDEQRKQLLQGGSTIASSEEHRNHIECLRQSTPT